jgi:hypothetical protein
LSHQCHSSERASPIDELLRTHVEEVELVAPMHWQVSVRSNGTVHPGQIRLEEDWLVFDGSALDAGEPAPLDAWKLLHVNSRLEGPAKFASVAGKESPRLIAEIPLDEEIELPDVLQWMLRCVASGLRSNTDVLAQRPLMQPVHSMSTRSPQELRALCSATGWPSTEKQDGGIAVELPTRRGVYSAIVRDGNGHGTHVSVPIASCGSLSDRSRHALSLLLLDACGLLRLARAAVHDAGDEAVAAFEVRLRSAPVAAELVHALAAVSVACDLCGPEAQALGHAATASHYLEARGQR